MFPCQFDVADYLEKRASGLQSTYNLGVFSFTINSGITIFVGPNGSGKTRALKQIRDSIRNGYLREVIPNFQKSVRYISDGRLGFFESNKSIYSYENDQRPVIVNDNSVDKEDTGSGIADFLSLSKKPDLWIKISEKLKKLLNREVFLNWRYGKMHLTFKDSIQEGLEYNFLNEASGLLHLIVILSALYNEEIRVLLLDEPEISLHPQLQAFLRKEIEQVAGNPEDIGKKIIVISTHSPEFINFNAPEDIYNIVFFEGQTYQQIKNSINIRQLSPESPELKNEKIRSLIMRMSYSHKSAFFCRHPILVEGVSDELISLHLSRIFNLNLDTAGAQILPVIGKGQMPVVSKFFKSIGKKPVILTDLDSFADTSTWVNSIGFINDLDSKAISYGHKNMNAWSSQIYNSFSYFANKSDIDDEQGKKSNEKKKRIFLKHLLNEDLFDTDLVSLKAQIDTLFDVLAEAGCFILRKGAIEDYYSQGNTFSPNEKLDKALSEMRIMDSKSLDDIEIQYFDILRAIKHVVPSIEIEELEIVCELVLAIAAPAVFMMSKSTSEKEILSMVKRILDSKENLFSINLIKEKQEDVLYINLKSNILNIEGFPLRFTEHTNVNYMVKNSLKRRK